MTFALAILGTLLAACAIAACALAYLGSRWRDH